jgi:hypothetical protein
VTPRERDHYDSIAILAAAAGFVLTLLQGPLAGLTAWALGMYLAAALPAPEPEAGP